MTQSTPHHVLIVGCGIAGLAAALFLKKAGIEAVIYEAHPKPRDNSGSFFGIHPNGRDVLETLGIADSALSEGTATHVFRFSSHKRLLTTVPTNVVTIERGAVARALRKEAIRQGIGIQYNKKLNFITQTHERVTATFDDGSRSDGSCLIGSDGIHSKTRRTVFGESPRPYYSGMVRSSAIFKNEFGVEPSHGVTNMFIGKDAFFSYLVRPDDYIYWFSNRFDKPEPPRGQVEAIPQVDWKDELMHLYIDDNPIIRTVIAETDGKIHKYPVYDMPLIDDWYKQRVCLIGDAAHAPLSRAGQGASMALEDAITIAKCLRDIPYTTEAFATFQSLRKHRVEKLYKKTRKSTSANLSRKLLGYFFDDLLLPIDIKASARRTSSMYNYHIDWNEHVEALRRPYS